MTRMKTIAIATILAATATNSAAAEPGWRPPAYAPGLFAAIGDFVTPPQKPQAVATTTHHQPAKTIPASTLNSSKILASRYGDGEKLNPQTATGERWNPRGLTVAHRTLPFGTMLDICMRSCTRARVNDRGPAAWTGRDIDLSAGTADAVGLTRAQGVGRVFVSLAR